MIVIIFCFVIIVNVIGFYFIVRNFLWREKYSGKSSVWTTVTKIFSVILNLVLIYGVFWGFFISFMFMSTQGIFYNYHKIYVSDFCTGFLLLETLFFLPYGINMFLYKIWYRKNNLCKWWILPSLLIGAVTFLMAVLCVITIGYINDWSTAKWK
ncbi:MAG: hypothetical protein K2L10_06430 [Ruminococcus sp.]|nr:hypothetical protein [Ruminococcus sp.]